MQIHETIRYRNLYFKYATSNMKIKISAQEQKQQKELMYLGS